MLLHTPLRGEGPRSGKLRGGRASRGRGSPQGPEADGRGVVAVQSATGAGATTWFYRPPPARGRTRFAPDVGPLRGRVAGDSGWAVSAGPAEAGWTLEPLYRDETQPPSSAPTPSPLGTPAPDPSPRRTYAEGPPRTPHWAQVHRPENSPHREQLRRPGASPTRHICAVPRAPRTTGDDLPSTPAPTCASGHTCTCP